MIQYVFVCATERMSLGHSALKSSTVKLFKHMYLSFISLFFPVPSHKHMLLMFSLFLF